MRYAVSQWNGGIANDPYAGQPGSLSDAQSVDIFSSSRSIKMTRDADDASSSGGKIVKFFLNDTDDANYPNAVVTYSPSPIAGDIRSLTGVSAYSFSSASPGAKECRNYARFTISGTDKILVFTAGQKVHSVSPTNLTSVSEDAYDIGAVTSPYRPVFVDNGVVYVGKGDTVASIDNFGTVTSSRLALRAGDVATYITKVADQLHIFAYGKDGGSRQYVCSDSDIAINKASRIIRISNVKIYNGATIGNYIYVKGRDSFRNDVIYSVYGYFDHNGLLYRSSDTNSATKFVWNSSPQERDMLAIGDFVYVGGYNCSYRYGKLFPGFQPGIVKEFLTSGGQVVAIGNSNVNGDVYLGTGSSYYRKQALNGSYSTTNASYVETLPFLGELASEKKRTLWFNITYKRTGVVKVYSNMDDAGYSIVYDSSTRTGFSSGIMRDTFQVTGDFQKLQLKVTMISIDGTSTPEVYDLVGGYDIIKQDVR